MTNVNCDLCGRKFALGALKNHIHGWSNTTPCIRAGNHENKNTYNEKIMEQNDTGLQCDDCGIVTLNRYNHYGAHKNKDGVRTYMNGNDLPSPSSGLTYTEVTKETVKDVRRFPLNSSATTEGSQGQSTAGYDSSSELNVECHLCKLDGRKDEQGRTLVVSLIDSEKAQEHFNLLHRNNQYFVQTGDKQKYNHLPRGIRFSTYWEQLASNQKA